MPLKDPVARKAYNREYERRFGKEREALYKDKLCARYIAGERLSGCQMTRIKSRLKYWEARKRNGGL